MGLGAAKRTPMSHWQSHGRPGTFRVQMLETNSSLARKFRSMCLPDQQRRQLNLVQADRIQCTMKWWSRNY